MKVHAPDRQTPAQGIGGGRAARPAPPSFTPRKLNPHTGRPYADDIDIAGYRRRLKAMGFDPVEVQEAVVLASQGGKESIGAYDPAMVLRDNHTSRSRL